MKTWVFSPPFLAGIFNPTVAQLGLGVTLPGRGPVLEAQVWVSA